MQQDFNGQILCIQWYALNILHFLVLAMVDSQHHHDISMKVYVSKEESLTNKKDNNELHIELGRHHMGKRKGCGS